MKCPACGGTRLSWGHAPARLTRRVLEQAGVQFYQGCDECSETVVGGITPDQVAAALELLDYNVRTETWAPRQS